MFDQLLVEHVDLLLPFPLGQFLPVLAGAVRRVTDHFAAKHIKDLMKTRTGIHRHLQGKHLGAEAAADIRQQPGKIRLLLVEPCHDDYFR